MYLLCKKGTEKIGNDLIPVTLAKTASGDRRPLALQDPDSELYKLYKNSVRIKDPAAGNRWPQSHWETEDGRFISKWSDPKRQLWAQGSYRLFQSLRAARLHKALTFRPRDKVDLFLIEVAVDYKNMVPLTPSIRSRS